MRRFRVVAVLSLFALVPPLAACGDDDHRAGGHQGDPMSDAGMGPGGHHDRDTPVADGARRIEVTATSFAFDPDEITVTAGEDVAIVLTSDDVLHDISVKGLDAHVAADRGETAAGGLRADEPGEYAFFCTISGHREAGMEGRLIVEEA